MYSAFGLLIVPAGHERDPHYPIPIVASFSLEPALLSVLWVARMNRGCRQLNNAHIVVWLCGCKSVSIVAIELSFSGPHRPDDSSHLIGQGHGGPIVADALLRGNGPPLHAG